jgi:DNA-binding NtrC family response regulator
MATILCVDDESSALLILRSTLDKAGHKTVGVSNVDAAFTVLARGGIDLIISDYRMPGTTGLEFITRLVEAGYEVPLIMATGYASIEHAVASIKAGAVDYITKPFRPEQLELVVDQALEFARLRRENARLREEVTQLRSDRRMIGDSELLQKIMQTVKTVAPTRATVLVQGESGTGKELLARALHELRDRAEGPLLSVNCAAMPESLVESMLFGHENGAFTGAVRQVKGAFERAHRGTLLLDEISEMRLDLQAKLLRVLQEQEFERVGGSTPVRVDVRVIATTNRDLAAEARAARFREDLFYRLSVVPLRVPPLRSRPADIPLLAHHFAHRTARELGKPVTGLSPDALALLSAHAWPGNVRELAHAVERAVILSPGPVIQADAFDLSVLSGVGPTASAATGSSNGGGDIIVLRSLNIDEAEKVLIEHALDATGQNRTRAAELLGISVRTLRNKLNRPEPEAD